MGIFKRKDELDIELDALYDRARHIVQRTKNYEEAAERLMEQEDINEQYARSIIDNLFTLDENRINFKRSILVGCSAIIVSTIPIVVSLSGGGYVIFMYGLLAFGLLTILRAFILYK